MDKIRIFNTIFFFFFINDLRKMKKLIQVELIIRNQLMFDIFSI